MFRDLAIKTIQICLQSSKSGSEFNCHAVAEHRKSMDRVMAIHSIFQRQGFAEPHLDSKLKA
jgi:hypothetical protein